MKRDCKEWFEACRCFHSLKEIDICVHSDVDCIVQLQINNHNHKAPQDWLSIELSFFSLWQTWILLLQGSQMTCCCWVCCECVCVCVHLFIFMPRAFKFPESMNYGHCMRCVWAILWQYIDVCFCVSVCMHDFVCSHGLWTTGHNNWIFIWALKSTH